jgi:hypothetical protein
VSDDPADGTLGASGIADRIWTLAGLEAAELGVAVVDVEHLLVASMRPEAGGAEHLAAVGVDARKVRDFAMFICGVNEVLASENEQRFYRRTNKHQRTHTPVVASTPEARHALETAKGEAVRSGQELSALHVLIACAPILVGFGATANDLRRANGLPVPVDAPIVAARDLPRPMAVGPLLLGGGGGEQVAAAALARLGGQPRVVWLGFDRDRPWLSPLARTWTACGVDVHDCGLYGPEDADRPSVVNAIETADVVLLDGGPVASLYETLTAGRAIDALVAASDRGALVVTSSGSSHLLGAMSVNPHGDDGPVREPTLRWLPSIVIRSHYTALATSLQYLRRNLWPFVNDEAILLVPHAGAVWIEPGWRHVSPLDAGQHDIGPAWWISADHDPVRIDAPSPIV